jgi:hypothetical protein
VTVEFLKKIKKEKPWMAFNAIVNMLQNEIENTCPNNKFFMLIQSIHTKG